MSVARHQPRQPPLAVDPIERRPKSDRRPQIVIADVSTAAVPHFHRRPSSPSIRRHGEARYAVPHELVVRSRNDGGIRSGPAADIDAVAKDGAALEGVGSARPSGVVVRRLKSAARERASVSQDARDRCPERRRGLTRQALTQPLGPVVAAETEPDVGAAAAITASTSLAATATCSRARNVKKSGWAAASSTGTSIAGG